ncbi:uncharacterized protein EI90DRAFT_3047467, partial [Cantharellus anzutake]|uniref:uncharacterized protein n=1 Tax=Cantharellus anzutake TaxID=1750568 RepID=UPI0019071DFE
PNRIPAASQTMRQPTPHTRLHRDRFLCLRKHTYQEPYQITGNITDGCLLWDDIANATLMVNPNFNVYRILDVCMALFWASSFNQGAQKRIGG